MNARNLPLPAILLVCALSLAAAYLMVGFDPSLILSTLPGAMLAGAMPGLVQHSDESAALQSIIAAVGEQGEAFKSFKDKQSGRLDNIEAAVTEMARKAGRPDLSSSPAKSALRETWYDVKGRREVAVLSHGESLAALEGTKSQQQKTSIGRVLRGMALGGRAHDASDLAEERKALGILEDPAGGYTVQDGMWAEWVDLMRAGMVLSQAGARMVPMPAGSMTMVRLMGDPAVSWHNENAVVPEGDPTFGSMTLTARTATCLTKVPVELAEDATNLEQMLGQAFVASLSTAIDSCGLVGVTTNAAIAPDGIFNLAGRNTVLSVGAPTNWDWTLDGMYELMADNMPLSEIGALIGHPALWKKMSKLKTGISGDNTALTMPEVVARLHKLWTTAAPLSGNTAKAVTGRWRDLIFGVRKGITIRVLRETYAGNLQIGLLAYTRVGFGAVRQESFVTMEGITV